MGSFLPVLLSAYRVVAAAGDARARRDVLSTAACGKVRTLRASAAVAASEAAAGPSTPAPCLAPPATRATPRDPHPEQL